MKYLPNVKLGPNVVADPNLETAGKFSYRPTAQDIVGCCNHLEAGNRMHFTPVLTVYMVFVVDAASEECYHAGICHASSIYRGHLSEVEGKDSTRRKSHISHQRHGSKKIDLYNLKVARSFSAVSFHATLVRRVGLTFFQMQMGDDGPRLISREISEQLGIDCSVLMGANIANEVGYSYFQAISPF